MVQDVTEPTGATKEGLDSPWRPLVDKGAGYLSVYYSEPLARWPIREITRPGDNKSDPNLETGTYGLFSTCEPTMRNRIIQDGAATVFFLTTRKGRKGRVLSGYYRIGYYTEGTQGAVNRDFALAAVSMRFVDPISTLEFPGALSAICSTPFRTMKPIGSATTSALIAECDRRPNQIERYLAEVQRIERFARARSGYAYPSWGREQGFSWDDAPEYYQSDEELSKVPNSSKSRKWHCRECEFVVTNAALLKKCPLCKKTSTLAPVEEGA